MNYWILLDTNIRHFLQYACPPKLIACTNSWLWYLFAVEVWIAQVVCSINCILPETNCLYYFDFCRTDIYLRLWLNNKLCLCYLDYLPTTVRSCSCKPQNARFYSTRQGQTTKYHNPCYTYAPRVNDYTCMCMLAWNRCSVTCVTWLLILDFICTRVCVTGQTNLPSMSRLCLYGSVTRVA